MTVTKNDLINLVVDTSGLAKPQARDVVESFFEVMTSELESGNEVKVSGFGNFILRNKKPRIGRNPKTREEFEIKARRVVSFHTSNIVKKALKEKDTK